MFKLRIDIVHSQPHKNSKQKKKKENICSGKNTSHFKNSVWMTVGVVKKCGC